MTYIREIQELRLMEEDYKRNGDWQMARHVHQRRMEVEKYEADRQRQDYGRSVTIPFPDYTPGGWKQQFVDERANELLNMVRILEGVQTKDELISILTTTTDNAIVISQLIEMWEVLNYNRLEKR